MKRLFCWRTALTAAMIAVCSSLGICAAEEIEELAASVHQRVTDWQPTKGERLLDQIGWAGGLEEAQRLAKEYDRPLFVFTYSGSTARANAIALQRC